MKINNIVSKFFAKFKKPNDRPLTPEELSDKVNAIFDEERKKSELFQNKQNFEIDNLSEYIAGKPMPPNNDSTPN